MRVLILSQYYFPEGVPKPHELAETLSANGHEVAVITGFPHYPGGKLREGYRLGLFKRETINQIPVLRTFEIPYHSTNPVLRSINYLSFLISAPFAAFFTPKCDVIYVWHPPLTVGIVAWIIAKIKRVPFVYDVQDIWPDFVVLSGMMRANSLPVRTLKLLERFVYQRATHLIVGTKAARQNLIEKNVAPEKISVLPNWIDEKMFAPNGSAEREAVRREFGWADKFVVLFAGNLGIVQGLETVIEAARTMPNKNSMIALVGDGTDRPRLEQLAREAQVFDRLQFIERQPMERMPAMMSAADALLVHLRKSDLSKYVIPSKTVAYLASGKPILMAMNGAAAELIGEAQAGLIIESGNAQDLASAIEKLRQSSPEQLEQYGINGRSFLEKFLTKKQVVVMYEQLLQQVAGKD